MSCTNTPEGNVAEFDFLYLYDKALASFPEWALSDLYEKISGKSSLGHSPNNQDKGPSTRNLQNGIIFPEKL